MRIFITGSSDGLGKLAATKLLDQGHDVIFHARNSQRAQQLRNNLPSAKQILIGDLSSIEETKRLASEVNVLGKFDAVIHNAGVYRDSKETIFRVNCLAPYILTSLIQKPSRLIYISSGLHRGGRINWGSLSNGVGYSDSKLLLNMLAMAVSRKWSDVYVNVINPGWVPTKMGGRSAPDDLQKGAETQVWLAVSDDSKAKVSGKYFFHKQEADYHPDMFDITKQEKFLAFCEQISNIRLPSI